MSKIKPCTCGAEPGMMYNRMTDDSLFFFMKCKVCGRRSKANSDVNLAVDDWNERIGGGQNGTMLRSVQNV
jgi:hypothetical protein